jgi:hypothetical protein
MLFTLFLMAELHSVTTAELKYLFAMVNRIKYTPVVDIVDYIKNVPKMSGPIECTSMVSWIAMNLRCPEMANLAYIEGDVPVLGYLTRAFDCTLWKDLHYSLIGWERRATAL